MLNVNNINIGHCVKKCDRFFVDEPVWGVSESQ